MKLTWSHALIFVNDLNEMLDFYTNILEFSVSDQTEKMAFISHLEDEHHQLALVAAEKPLAKAERLSHFAFRVESLQDVKEMFERLLARPRQGKITPITHGSTWSIYFADPEGNGIELFCDTPWIVTQPFGSSWDPRASDDEIVSATEKIAQGVDGFRPNEHFVEQPA